jgi:hypothetical protein
MDASFGTDDEQRIFESFAVLAAGHIDFGETLQKKIGSVSIRYE